MKKKLLVGLSAVLLLSICAGAVILTNLLNPLPWGPESRNAQVVQSLSREQNVVLLSLGIQGIAEESVKSSLFGVELPGSQRALFLQYQYSAKLGVDGSQVTVEEVAEHECRVVVPEFSFMGHSDVQLKTAVESNGLVSWVTPEIDVPAVITEILSESAKGNISTTIGTPWRSSAKGSTVASFSRSTPMQR